MLTHRGCPLTRRFGKDVAIVISKILWDFKMQHVLSDYHECYSEGWNGEVLINRWSPKGVKRQTFLTTDLENESRTHLDDRWDSRAMCKFNWRRPGYGVGYINSMNNGGYLPLVPVHYWEIKELY